MDCHEIKKNLNGYIRKQLETIMHCITIFRYYISQRKWNCHRFILRKLSTRFEHYNWEMRAADEYPFQYSIAVSSIRAFAVLNVHTHCP